MLLRLLRGAVAKLYLQESHVSRPCKGLFFFSVQQFNTENFISTHVTKRAESMFLQDLRAHEEELTSEIRGKSVLVIGGAGSIGSSFIRALLPYQPKSLVIVDTNENGLAELTRDIRSRGLPVPENYLPYPMDYSSSVFRKMFIARGGFDVVANFSAHKHVRSEKDIFSVEALFANNVFHAAALLDLLEEYPPESFFCVSTDKAANPVNLMGASKRIMEDMIFSRTDAFPVKTARFANVAFSNGSLPDGFLHRIARQQPLTAPKDVKRYFVSPEESGQICLMACMLGKTREIFFPKLDENQMMGFDEIAEKLLKEYGYTPLYCESEAEAVERSLRPAKGGEYPLYIFNSDTSGEKPFEEFYVEGETLDMERFEALGVITGKEQPSRQQVSELIRELERAFGGSTAQGNPGAKTEDGGVKLPSKEDIVQIIGGYLPNFAHIETGKSLDQRM